MADFGRQERCVLRDRKVSWEEQVVALVFILSIAGTTAVSGYVAGNQHLGKRSFFDIQCKGRYDRGIFEKLNRVCDDCYNVYRDTQLRSLCSQKCFSSRFFSGCLEALTLGDDEPEYQQMILAINANNPFDMK